MSKRLALGLAAAALVVVALVVVGPAGAWLVSRWPQLQEPQVSLSVFEPHAGGCAWSRYDVTHRRSESIARFPADCQNVQVSFRLDGKEALVWFAAESPQEVMLYRIDVRRGKQEQLPVPTVGDPETYLFDRQGRVLALSLDQQVTVTAANEDGPGFIEQEGRRYPASTFPEGVDALAYTLSLETAAGGGLGWRVVETRATRCCEGAAPGTRELEAAAALRRDDELRNRQSSELLTASGRFAPVDDAKILAALPGAREGSWLTLREPSWQQALIFHGLPGEVTRATGLAFLASNSRTTPLPGLALSATDVVQLMTQNNLLLITGWATGAEPYLYDMRSGTLLYSSKVATGTVLWPQTVPALTHPR